MLTTTTEPNIVTVPVVSDSGDDHHDGDGGNGYVPKVHLEFDYPYTGDGCDDCDDAAAAKVVSAQEDGSENEDKNLPEYNGEDIIGYTWYRANSPSGSYAKWNIRDYNPLPHTFAYKIINCGDLEICEGIHLSVLQTNSRAIRSNQFLKSLYFMHTVPF